MSVNTSDRGQTFAVGSAIILDTLSQVRAVGISACELTLSSGELDLKLVQDVSGLGAQEILPFVQPRGVGTVLDAVATVEWIDAHTIRLHNFDAAGDEDKSGVVDFVFFRFELGVVPVIDEP